MRHHSRHLLVRVPPALKARATEAAKAAELTRSEFVRRAIEAAVAAGLSTATVREARP